MSYEYYVIMSAYAFYSYLGSYFYATLYLPMKSMKVLCVSLPLQVPLFISLPLLV